MTGLPPPVRGPEGEDHRRERGRRWLAADRRAVSVATFPLAVFALVSLAGFVPGDIERFLRPLWFLYPLIAANIVALALYDTFNTRARTRRRAAATHKNRSPGAPSPEAPSPEDISAAEPAGVAGVEVLAPVTGRWQALNSPADKVPSHGTDAHAQTYAIDITAAPEGAPERAFGWWPVLSPATAYPAFGAPVRACADATVVSTLDRRADHRSRDSYPGLALLLLEGLAREFGGVSWLLGNHVVLRLDGTADTTGENGTAYAVYAHLKRGSITVTEGDTLNAGQPLAQVGNSGSSSEPHLHFQLMDGPDTERAHGLPFTWHGLGVPAAGPPWEVPETGETGEAGEAGEVGDTPEAPVIPEAQ